MNRAHKLNRKIVTGVSGSGKTTLYAQLILASGARWKFVYDPEGEFAGIAGIPVAYTVEDLETQLSERGIVAFNPEKLFADADDELSEGLIFFCRWVFEICERLNGTKLLAVDEIQDCTPMGAEKFPRPVKRVADKGRRYSIDSIFCTNAPNELHPALRRQVSEIITFLHVDPTPWDWLQKRGFESDEVKALPEFHYIQRNMKTGVLTRSKTSDANRPRKASSGKAARS